MPTEPFGQRVHLLANVLGIGADGDVDGSLTVSALGTHKIRSVGAYLTAWAVPAAA